MQGKNYTIGQSFSPALDVTCERPVVSDNKSGTATIKAVMRDCGLL